MQIFHIGENDAGQRLDKYLTKSMKFLPSSLLYKAIRTKKIKVNRKRTQQNYMLNAGDTIEIFLPDEYLVRCDNSKEAFLHLLPRLHVIYDDKNLLICDKQPGLLVHADEEESVDTLITISKHICIGRESTTRSENTPLHRLYVTELTVTPVAW